MSPHPSSSSASSRTHDDDTGAHPPPPPPKRVRREYPWRPEYEREFGVRPIQVDAATGDAVLVECRFCVSFGREAPVAPATPPVNKVGQPIKSRARTRNVAHWKYPFRTDNMRSHHLQQHAHKWAEYSTLLEQSKQHPHASGSDAADGGEQRASLRLSSFFGESQESGVTTPAGATVVPVADAALPAAISATSSTGGAPSSAAMYMLVPHITNTAIVDTVLPFFVDVPTSDADLSSSEATTWLQPVRSSGSGIDEDSSVTQYSLESSIATRGMVRLLAAGLSFRQVAEVAPSLRASDAAKVTRGDVVAFARALVASSLERIAQLVAVVWTYSIRFSVDAPSSDTSPAPLRVCLRVPVDESREIEDFHVVTIALHQASEAKANVATLIRAILSAVDRHWEKKASSVVIDGATHCLGVHTDLVERVVRPLLTEPVLSIRDGRQDVEHALQTAWAQYRRGEDDSAVFAGTLLQLVERVRADTEIVRAHHHCPLVQLHDALSVLRTLKWLLARREALADSNIDAPMRWWLIAHVIADLWSDCLATFADKGTGQSRDAIELLAKTLMEKCGVQASKTNDKARHANESPDNVEFDEATRAASLRVDATSSRLSWTTRDIAQCLRTLNVSTRRMFADVSKDAVLLRTAERQAARFVLLLLGQLTPLAFASNQKKTLSKQLPPPTRPLDFGAMEAADVVDFVEKHSHRLELAFPTMFLDLASREIRELQTLLATDEQLRSELEQVAKHPRMSSQLSAFAAAWVLVPQFPAAQTLAAGLATALPRQRTNAEGPVVAFSRAENGLVPPGVMVDLAVEACAHAQQLERLQDAAAESPCDDSLVV